MREDIYDGLEDHISDLEKDGLISPDCRMCEEFFYPKLKQNISFSAIFAPRHKASKRCESGKWPHCTCDVCF